MIQTETKEKQWLHLMRSLLHHNVPRFISHMLNRGGVQEQEWKWLQSDDNTEDPDNIRYVIDRGDECLLYPKDEKTFFKNLHIFVKALAIMAFIPGGVRIFGLRFWSELPGFVDDEG